MDNKLINNKNSELKILISVVIVIIVGIILASSYAFFNYTRAGNTITLSNGEINFNFTEGNTISKGNAFPMTTADIDNTVTKTFSLTGHTTYANGIRYNIYVIYGDNETGKTRLRDDVVSFRFTPPANANGFTNEVNNCSTPTSLTFTNGKALAASGLIKNTSGSTTKNYTLELFIDSNKINVSSTTKRANNAEGNPSLADATNGTTTATRYMRNNSNEASTITLYPAVTSQQGKIIYTTNEFSNSFYSFKILVEANEETPPICKRATTLHTEECTNSSTTKYCYPDGYRVGGSKNTTTITYGNTSVTSGELHTGDAFDCDVNGDGIVNVDTNGNSTERFYYVSPYYDTNANPPAFDNTTATLIYYSNTYNGVASTSGAAYYASANENWHGPVTAATHLPSTSQWRNIQLKATSRTILACDNGNCSNTPVLTTNNGSNTIENPFNYTGKAARLLTLKELKQSGCDTLSRKTSITTTGSLTACNFLFEGTKYADSSKATDGPWLETPPASNSYGVWSVYAYNRNVYVTNANSTGRGARPVIDVPISKIEY